ncbi:Retrovirus-related Pol polyprotein from transposon [Smittium culicis]|uniref:Retrovirus-related Pol polyprotein from transposon n=1 Tax=Smittium culicis TaxID=133412 RepID=A0A1R1X855_9FUNG|nr:Retrovirus-related Pol polyprotein from transposon [Smittium culicis]
MEIQELEAKITMIDNQLKAKEEELTIRKIELEKQTQILQQEHAKHNEMVERINIMQQEGQSVTTQLEQMKIKNKTLQKEKKIVEQDLEYSNSHKAIINNETEFEKQKQLYLSEVVKQQKDLIDNIINRPQFRNQTRTGKEIPLPSFEGNPLKFQRLISNVDDYFIEYSYITNFERKHLVVSALTKKAKEWYSSTNDTEVSTWDNLYHSLKKEYRNEITYIEAINIINTVRLTIKSKYSDFINKIRPSVAVMSKGDAEFSITLIMDCIEKEIKMFLPILPKETIQNFENRLMEQHRALSYGIVVNSSLISSFENSRTKDKSLKDQDGDWIMAVNEINNHEFLVMPQGMSKSPATFQQTMDNTLRTAIEGGYCAAFADDISIFSKNKEDHLVNLKNVLEMLEEKGFKLNKDKCTFGVLKVQILGYTISENGQEISPDKIYAVKNYPRPTNETSL